MKNVFKEKPELYERNKIIEAAKKARYIINRTTVVQNNSGPWRYNNDYTTLIMLI